MTSDFDLILIEVYDSIGKVPDALFRLGITWNNSERKQERD